MPPKKRALAESDSNAQSASKRNQKKQSKSGQMAKENEQQVDTAHQDEHRRKHVEIDSEQPHDWICIDPMPWCKRAYEDDDEKDDEEAEDEEDSSSGEPKQKMFRKAASEHPNHKWVMMGQSWTMLLDWMRRADYTNPDAFGMYGLAELLENLLAEFDKAKTKHAKSTDKHVSLLDMWAPMATLGHWINSDDAGSFGSMDDGERTCKLIGLTGCAFVNMLDTIDRGGQMKADSEIKDLGLIISLYLKWSMGQEDYGIDEEEIEWRELLVAYAKKAGIDLVATGCSGTAATLEEVDAEDSTSDALKNVAKRFNWTKTLKEYKKEHTSGNKLGGEQYNIMKMSRAERASHAFDRKDPLAGFSDKDIKEGKLALS